jgi:hypothetical protein
MAFVFVHIVMVAGGFYLYLSMLTDHIYVPWHLLVLTIYSSVV